MRLKKGAIARHCNTMDFGTCFDNSPALYNDIGEWIDASNIFDTISDIYTFNARNSLFDIITDKN